MKKNGHMKPDTKDLSLLSKRGICIYVQCAFVINHLLNRLFRFFDERHKLSREHDTQLMKELASYVYFETVKQMWEYQEGSLSEKDAREVLDVVSTCFFHTYGLDNLEEKLTEYQSAENPTYVVGRNIVRTVTGSSDIRDMMMVSIDITAAMIHVFFDELRRMFELSEADMAELIEDFFVNHYPQMTEQG